jgi:uncharacterized protein
MRACPATPRHFEAILALNQDFVEVLAPLSLPRLERLHAVASCHRVVLDERDEVIGFVLAFGSDAPHDSVNFKWFCSNLADFLYVDRVAVSGARQGAGVGRFLYEELFRFARARGYRSVTCEIDSEPPNPRSARFHARLGFRELGRQDVEYVDGQPKRVSLQARAVDA